MKKLSMLLMFTALALAAGMVYGMDGTENRRQEVYQLQEAMAQKLKQTQKNKAAKVMRNINEQRRNLNAQDHLDLLTTLNSDYSLGFENQIEKLNGINKLSDLVIALPSVTISDLSDIEDQGDDDDTGTGQDDTDSDGETSESEAHTANTGNGINQQQALSFISKQTVLYGVAFSTLIMVAYKLYSASYNDANIEKKSLEGTDTHPTDSQPAHPVAV